MFQQAMRSASNPVKDAGMLLEALEHLSAYMRDKGHLPRR
jgi:hypothetical protein